jgi:hypothetical protein
MKTSIYQTLDDLLSDLTERENDIIKRRFGIGYEPHSLEKIGNHYGITRERVRQIEERILERLKEKIERNKFLQSEFLEILNEILGKLKLKREKYTFEKFQSNFGLDTTELRIIRFFYILHPQIYYHKETKEFHPFLSTYQEIFEKGKTIINHFKKLLIKKWRKTWSEQEILDLLSYEIKNHFGIEPDVDDIYDLLKIYKFIRKNPLGEIGHILNNKVAPTSLKDKIKIIFELEKRPLHFTEIYQKLKELSQIEDELIDSKWKRDYTPQSVHNILVASPDFVLYGRGKYVPRYWGYEPGTALDFIKRIVKKHKEIDMDKLYEIVKKHKDISRNTFSIYIYKYFKVKNKKVRL